MACVEQGTILPDSVDLAAQAQNCQVDLTHTLPTRARKPLALAMGMNGSSFWSGAKGPRRRVRSTKNCEQIRSKLVPNPLDTCSYLAYNMSMKVRVNMYIEEEDKKIIRFIREKYNLDSDAMAVRFLLRKYAKSEGYKPDKTKGKE